MSVDVQHVDSRQLAAIPRMVGSANVHLYAVAGIVARVDFASPLIALSIGIAVSQPGLNNPILLVMWACLLCGVYLAPRRKVSRKQFMLLAIIPASALIAVPVSFFTSGEWAATIVLAIFTFGLFPLFLVDNLNRVLPWIIPVWALHAGMMAWQRVTEDAGINRLGGLAINQNVASSFLLLGAIYLVHTRFKWLSVPLLVTILFTGSRWSTLVAAGVFAAIFICRKIDWRYLLVGMVVSVGVVSFLGWDSIIQGYRVHGDTGLAPVSEMIERNRSDIAYRWNIPSGSLFLIPTGYIGSSLHNVPARMATETGLLSALAWLGFTGWGLWKFERLSGRWWMLLAVSLLSMMYFLTWLGPLGAFWWLLLSGERAQFGAGSSGNRSVIKLSGGPSSTSTSFPMTLESQVGTPAENSYPQNGHQLKR